ncbi:UDP-N-acetylmuramoyl-L-alanine--D-glutamate ligase [Sphingomonas koreensis]|uniref:UDP-N-acetylmuramoyl-L-alanine--D-glutamate ligase n=1 Tax=Sphingomonas koreensis TaxID=93064 RepID=UPI000833CD31|nr:UDP-N-acetylmuramoyl-L-alanine--D-glutamate ligase [Sphingomonas koreensis]PJI90137.1 UDP-N-acetylmuramoylalanine--D-glutamate ligase [Sphingomonas koreensis]RSU62425.1 UDP-N-acetylmuramoyl-L-alanine--D-glutamate ligase [Sphingomonas koreensis]RSU70136.1 UDP-N-acetylmuramoyl-L-alanine--D-glutamate ligase [Sphingomonas koreensis]
MIVSTSWRGKRYAVLGLARSGLATMRALLAAQSRTVSAWDMSEERRDAAFELAGKTIADLPIGEAHSFLLQDPLETDLTGFAGVAVSPGVPINHHPIAARARAAGVPLIGDIELFAQARAELPAHKVVGITGTNGKSTTTALIHHILETAGIPARLGGNIGLPILGQEPLPEGGIYVLELSSYQIDLTQTLDCDVAVLLNITPDHLDRYDGFESYAASKAELFEMQSKGHAAIIGIGDEASQAIAKQVSRAGRAEDLTRIAPGVCMDQSRWPALQGPHNAQNALAAIAACEALGVAQTMIEAGLRSFPGLPHRMERVATVNGVLFVNDSKATNPTSTAPALEAFDRIHWILGGLAKTDDLDACRPGFGHVVRAYTIGDATELFAGLLKDEFPVEESGTLSAAVKAAAARAQPGETVLLSPACASFDQFRDFEDRGAQFREAVGALR